ncbi:MAG: type II toxin-antitoxin system PemK/MazF family toxin [Candidatus Uhrbacteria bacterium]
MDKEKFLDFVNWTKLKVRIHFSKQKQKYFKEREIWWASLGMNIGYEQDGKHNRFERPVLILRVFNFEVLWILPLTGKDKTEKHYYQFEYNGKKSSVILSQIRLISSKRLIRKIRTLPEDQFLDIKTLIKNYL